MSHPAAFIPSTFLVLGSSLVWFVALGVRLPSGRRERQAVLALGIRLAQRA